MLYINGNNNYVINYDSVLCKLPNVIDSTQSFDIIKTNVITNLLCQIYEIVDFLFYYPIGTKNMFNKLKVFCENNSNVYNVLTVFKECIFDMFEYIKITKLPHLSNLYMKCVDKDDVLLALIKN
jgi:hypothetical protein